MTILIAAIALATGIIIGILVRNKAVKEAEELAAKAHKYIDAQTDEINKLLAEKADSFDRAKDALIEKAKDLIERKGG
jgi:hypothetical protein